MSAGTTQWVRMRLRSRPIRVLRRIGMTMGAYRWLRPDGRRTATEIAEEFSTALLRGLIRDDKTRVESPLGEAVRAGRTKKVHA